MQDRDSQKTTWISKFVEEVKNDRMVLPALKQIREIFQLFSEVWFLSLVIFVILGTYNNTTTTTVLWTLYRSTCITCHFQLRTGGILLVQSFTAHIPLLMATSGLGM